MTIVIGFNVGQYSIISGDSRLTDKKAGKSVDCCQKVFAISRETVVGFCGHLDAIADLLSSFRLWRAEDAEATTIEKLRTTLPDLLRTGWADFCRAKQRNQVDLGMIIAGRTESGRSEMFLCESPSFPLQEIPIGKYGVIGSGAPAVERCGDQLATILNSMEGWFNDQGFPAPYALGWFIGNLLDSYLRKLKIDSVGRVFHTVLLDANGAWNVPYEITQPGSSVKIGTKKGNDDRWVQYRSDGVEIPLLDPIDIMARWQEFPRVWNLRAGKRN